jgi:hypothetical protein
MRLLKAEKEIQLADGGGGGEEKNHTTARKPVLYKSFNTLCAHCSVQGKVRAEHKLKQTMIETDANRTFIR